MASSTLGRTPSAAGSDASATPRDGRDLVDRQREALELLGRLSKERAAAEVRVERRFEDEKLSATQEYEGVRDGLRRRYEKQIEVLERETGDRRASLIRKSEAAQAAAQAAYEQATRRARSIFSRDRDEAVKTRDDARWQAGAVAEASRDGIRKRLDQAGKDQADEKEAYGPIEQDALETLSRTGRFSGLPGTAVDAPAAAPEGETASELFARVRGLVAEATADLERLEGLLLPKLLAWKTYPWAVAALIAALAGAGWFAAETIGAAAGAAVGLALGVGLRPWLVGLARRKVSGPHAKLSSTIGLLAGLFPAVKLRHEDEAKRDLAAAKSRHEAEQRAGDEAHDAKLAQVTFRRDSELKAADAMLKPLIADAESQRLDGLGRIEIDAARLRDEADLGYEKDGRRLDREHERRIVANRARHEAEWAEMADRWRDGLGRVDAEIAAIDSVAGRLFFDWARRPADEWRPNTLVPATMRFGSLAVDPAEVPDAISHDEALRVMGPSAFSTPALIPFPEEGSLLLRAYGEGRNRAVDAIQAAMLRRLTSLPASKVKFTIIDPVGLGRNFAAFMHLVDFDESMVTSRIWTEERHIEQRLVDLTEHMENVIQKYLRNEYTSIRDYNEHAGEVAEPFRVLVVANFPAGFSDQAARRLLSVAAGGARCGVTTLISVDERLPLPQGFALKDLEAYATVLAWREGKFTWRGSPFGGLYPLTLDAPPPAEVFTAMVQSAGARAKEAGRVEVPFHVIAPDPADYWMSDSAKGIDVPLGRAGATRLQHLTLGRGTAQHVLIAGRTGSGKSTLLHALITNLALRYSPDQVEMFLIDFKKGVEFKTYAVHGLPHARVVAIESEREFGLSVLQRLDEELKQRGDQFRDAGAQDLAAYRKAVPDRPMPRLLLIVDEFQEFFVEDDKLGQEAALLLDRLVRQGRAFGIHVHLGSQTLSGAYSLARSTLGQMAVRIALQCSEADAHLILSEDNSAARLLSRPGEAIYNDANGMIEGNHIFQVVWLSDERRDVYLDEVKRLDRERPSAVPRRPPLVFEGNIPARIEQNPLLARWLEPTPGRWPEPPKVPHAWLGDAIAIKDPTAATFRRQGGANLLLIGQQDEMATAVMASCLLSLAAQLPPSQVRFILIDGTPVDASTAGVLASMTEGLPHRVDMVGTRDVGTAFNALGEELERRQGDASAEAQAVFVLIHDLQRFRDLRRAEDSYGGFGSYGAEKVVSPAERLATLLREGPPLGIHVLAWADSLNNANRSFDRPAMREFSSRVLFQMSPADSSNLVDGPAASRLGTNRAYLHEEEQGRLEKFRPFGLPTAEFLADYRRALAERAE
ncbi:FtsK/SpoIIIE domain-containing protein [Isosphaeraceae bacterium EP7]